MIIKCKTCHTIFNAAIHRAGCTSCGNTTGGFRQEPKSKEYGGKLFHLEDILVHLGSKNEYQVRELQSAGFIVQLTTGVKAWEGGIFYISKNNLDEYAKKGAENELHGA
jgi:hypothetical protein